MQYILAAVGLFSVLAMYQVFHLQVEMDSWNSSTPIAVYQSVPQDFEFNDKLSFEDLKVDVVYTFVNGTGAEWNKKKDLRQLEYLSLILGKSKIEVQGEVEKEKVANGKNRFREHHELKYSMRSVDLYAKWIRKIHVVVSGRDQVPSWMNVEHPKINIVLHGDIFVHEKDLPTYNSAAIEANIHRIKGLSDYYLYLNDDFFIGKEISMSDFLKSPVDGTPVVYFDFYTLIKGCSNNCNATILGNGVCDQGCNTPNCNWDMGDCGIENTRKEQTKFENRKQPYRAKEGSFANRIVTMNGLLTREFGKSKLDGERRPIAHVPYLLNKHMVQDLENRFLTLFESTSSHPFRHPGDFQFSFLYYYYLIEVDVYAPTMAQLWHTALKTVSKVNHEEQIYFLFGKPALDEDRFQRAYRSSIMTTTAYHQFYQCAYRYTYKNDYFEHNQPYRKECLQHASVLLVDHRIRLPTTMVQEASLKDVAFHCLHDKLKSNLYFLNDLIKNPRKFMCIEDDMKQYYPVIEAKLAEMYNTHYPDPSPFEAIN